VPDLDERFRALSRTRAPELWPDVETRPPGPLPPTPRGRRVVSGVTALAVAVAGFVVVVTAFRDEAPVARQTPSPFPPALVANGPIYFQHLGDDGTRTPPGSIESVEPDGSDRRTVFEDEPMRITQLAWSPDGSRIAYVDPMPGEHGIYVANADGTNPVRLTDGPNDGDPSWSPDGTRIVFSSTAYDSTIEFCDGLPGQEFLCPTDLYTMEADGSNVVRLTTDRPAEFQPAWSPDGSRIAFTRTIGGTGTRVFSIAVDGTDERPVSSSGGGSDFWPTWSPDGARIAFVGFRWEDFGLWVVGSDGSDEREIEENGFAFAPWWRNDPTWSPDGTAIAFVCLPDEYADSASLCLARPDGTGLERIAEIPWSAGALAWQPIVADNQRSPDATVEPSPPAEPSPPLSPPDATIGETIEVGQSNALIAAAGSVWVAGFDAEPPQQSFVLRIDEATGEVVARIDVDAVPGNETGGAGMAFDGRFVWMVGTAFERAEADRGVLVRIDPETNEAETFDLGVGAAGSSLYFEGGSLWTTGVASPSDPPRLLRIDPATGAVLVEVPFEAEWWGSLVVVDDAVWITEMTVVDSTVQGDPTLVQLDSATGEELTRVSLGHVYGLPASTGPVGSDLFYAVAEGGLVRVDPQTGEVLDRMPAEIELDLELGPDGAVWYLGWESLHRLDPTTGETDVSVDLERGVTPIAIAVTEQDVWVLNYQGTLTRVDLR